ncbi:MAG TPA: Ig-like domain-containing protein, partial [Anaerolineales bacterium]|nr:Ig-like domain-containing protein [Anaerolineales bacterium]
LFQNGKRELHAILGLPTGVEAAVLASPGIRINEIMAGANGDSRVQFIEIEVENAGLKCWGPQRSGDPCFTGGRGEKVGRLMLVFFDASGNQTGRYVFPADPAGNFKTVLVATQAFADLPGAPVPDFLITPEIVALSGQVCLRGNPSNVNAPSLNLCLAYGSFTGPQQANAAPGDPVGGPFSGPLNGPPVSTLLPILDTLSLKRSTNMFGDQFNGDFTQATRPAPHNTSNQTFVIPFANQVQQGENLFSKESFGGNGRACATCHVPAEDFGLSLATIDSLPPTDLLFVPEFNLSTITVAAQAEPSDLRGLITAPSGATATVHAGSVVTYRVYGGNAGLVGQTVTDGQGNKAVVQSFAPGDLGGLEESSVMHTRALILENIDGFGSPPNMRATPHLLNLKFSGQPFGWSGEVTELGTFTINAIRQHATRSLARVDGVDFRLPTVDEMAAIDAFQLTIKDPQNENFDLELYATTAAQQRGRSLFFSARSCGNCHFATALSAAPRPDDNGQQPLFNTGLNNQLVDGDLPQEPPQAGEQGRAFSISPLFGIRNTAPFFHEHSAATFEDVVRFYMSDAFANSVAAQGQTFRFPQFTDQDVMDIVAFLDGLEEKPYEYTRAGYFGAQITLVGPTPSQTFVITNTSATASLSVSNVSVVNADGSQSPDYVINSSPPTGPFGPGDTRSIEVSFKPTVAGVRDAVLEFTVTDTATGETFHSGVALQGSGALGEPTITGIADQMVDIGTSTGALAFTISPGTATLSASSSNTTLVPLDNIVFSGSGVSRTLTVTPAAGLNGSADITVIVDQAGSTVSDTFTLDVNGIPTVSSIPGQSSAEDVPVTLSFDIADVETPAADMVLTAVSSNPAIVPDNQVVLGGAGTSRTVTITPLSNQSGSTTITVSVYDKVWTVNRSFAVAFNAVNDAPEITNLNSQTTSVNLPTEPQTFGIFDVDNEPTGLTLTATSSNITLVPESNIAIGGNDGTRTVTVTPAENQGGSAVITITVSDGTSSASSAFSVEVVDTANCTAACLRSASITISLARSAVIGQVVVKDEDGANISGATVSATWTLPDESTINQTLITNTQGEAIFKTSTGGSGLYVLTVTNITKAGFTFDPANSVLTASITK